MPKSISKMEDSKKLSIDFLSELPKYPHSAIICGQTGCGKTEFVLDLLESEYAGVFENIVILCPTINWNKAYKNRCWIGDVRKPKDKKHNNSESCDARWNRKTSGNVTVVF